MACRIGIIEHNIGRLLRNLFTADPKVRSAEKQIIFEKAARYFLIQQNQQCIVVINIDFAIQSVNDAYLRIVGKHNEKVIGECCYRAIHGLDAPCYSLRTGQSTKGFHSL